VVAVALFDPAANRIAPNNPTMTVVNILGFFIERMSGKDVVGVFTGYTGMAAAGGDVIQDTAAFSKTVVLVR
jgi:hypothetical protein